MCLSLLYFNFLRKPSRLPPGEWGWPLIGCIPSLNILWMYQVEAMKQKHGKIFHWKIGGRLFVYICDYKICKSVFSTNEASDRPDVFSLNLFTKLQGGGIASSNNRACPIVRRFVLHYLKESALKVSSVEDTFAYELQCLIDDLKLNTGKPTEVPWSVNVVVTNILWKFIAGKRFDVDDKRHQAFEKVVYDIFSEGQKIAVAAFDFFPQLNTVFPNNFKRILGLGNLIENTEKCSQFIREEIDEHLSTLDPENPRDFIDNFLIEMTKEKEKKSNTAFSFSYEELQYTLAELFFAGTETTSSMFRWLILFLAKYPKVQRKVQEEIDTELNKERLPSFSDKEKLIYTQAVIYEVLRMVPVGPFSLYHRASKNISVSGYDIPKGTFLISSIFSCHFDPDYWENPSEFIPERFITPEGKLDVNKDGFVAFSTGRRSCIGEKLALMSLFYFITGILQKFDLSAPEGIELDLRPDQTKNFFLVPESYKFVITERV
ncbi:UNVERIFIED_CONTAM: hypothetical protein RMT77_016132 [Armadillidium vulgare]